jgi:hypothetical protein
MTKKSFMQDPVSVVQNAPVPVISNHEALSEKGIQGYCSLTEDTR